jgi:hypothetical protein
MYHFFFSQPSKKTMPQNTCSNMITSVMKAERQTVINVQCSREQTTKFAEHAAAFGGGPPSNTNRALTHVLLHF